MACPSPFLFSYLLGNFLCRKSQASCSFVALGGSAWCRGLRWFRHPTRTLHVTIPSSSFFDCFFWSSFSYGYYLLVSRGSSFAKEVAELPDDVAIVFIHVLFHSLPCLLPPS